MKQFSILIPTYNDVCTTLVQALQRQAEKLGTDYEILVADDASTQQDVVDQNRSIINALPQCRYIERKQNVGRAHIRNFLARESQYDYLIFIDADMIVPHDDYLKNYAENECNTVIDGGVIIRSDGAAKPTLRYRYEKQAEQAHTVKERQQHPYQHFHTANFMVARHIMLAHPFDERFTHYGYEDVLFGKQLQQHGIHIAHIDNPLSFEVFEDNASFISKTEEGLRTLRQFQTELDGYSNMLAGIKRLQKYKLLPVIRGWHRLFGAFERKLLARGCGSLKLFTLYRVGYFLSLRP